MIDEDKRASLEENVKQFNERAAKYHSSRATYVSHEELHGGRRTIVTTVLHELGCAGIGHAIQAPGDVFEAEVATLLSLGRAYQGLGKRMVERGLAVSKDLDRIGEVAGRVADKFCATVWPKMNDDQRKVHHVKRLVDAINSGAVIECRFCCKNFGIKGKRTRREVKEGMPEGLKKLYVRYHLCPHCNMWRDNPNDIRDGDRKIKEFLESKSQPPQTGAPGGEPGPSVPTGTEGKAMTPQGDDGQTPLEIMEKVGDFPKDGIQRYPAPVPTRLGTMSFKPTDDGQDPLPNRCLTCSRHCKKKKYTCMDYVKAHICSACGKPIMDGDNYYTTGFAVGKIYHHPRCTPKELMGRASKATREEPQGDDGQQGG